MVARAALEEIHHGGIVHRRIGLGARDQRRDAADRGGGGGRGDGFAMFRAGFADEGAQVDQAGTDHVAAAIDDGNVVRQGLRRDFGAEILDPAILDQHAAARLGSAFGVDQPGVDKGERRVRIVLNHGFR